MQFLNSMAADLHSAVRFTKVFRPYRSKLKPQFFDFLQVSPSSVNKFLFLNTSAGPNRPTSLYYVDKFRLQCGKDDKLITKEDEVKEDPTSESRLQCEKDDKLITREDEVKEDPTSENLASRFFLVLTLQQLAKEGFFTLTPQQLDKFILPRGWGPTLAMHTMIICLWFLLEAVKSNPESIVVAKAVLAPLEKYVPKDVFATLTLALIGAEQAIKLKKEDPNMVTYDDLVGLDEAKTTLRWAMQKLKGETEVSRISLTHGILICGRYGTGKKTLVHATAREYGVSFFPVEGVNVGKSDFLGVNLTRLFTEAKACAPSIILIKNIDDMTSKSSELLLEMNKCATAKSKVMVLATTENPDKVDIELIKSQLFNKQVQIGNLKENERQKIISLHLEKFILKEDEASVCMYIANETSAVVPSDLISIVIDSVDYAAERGSNLVAMEDAEKAVKAFKLKFKGKESLPKGSVAG